MRTKTLKQDRDTILWRDIRAKTHRTSYDKRYFSARVLRRLIFIGILTSLIIFLIMKIIIWSGVFKVRKIEVRGNEVMSDEMILDLLDIEKGMSISKISEDEINERLKGNSRIEEVKIQTSLSGSVTVDVLERVVVGFITFNDTLRPITSEGHIIIPKKGVSEEELPFISGKRFIAQGEPARINDVEILKVLEIMGKVKMEEPELFMRFESTNIKKYEIITSDGIKIIFDSENDIEDYYNLSQVYMYCLRENIKSLDMRFEYGIVAKLSERENEDENSEGV